MESLKSLENRKRQLEYELESITLKKHGSTSWSPGVLDQHKSDSYSMDEYTDVSKAYRLKDEINHLNNLIETYAQRAKAERDREEFLIESQIPKYEYNAGGKKMETENPAIAARYDAQHRFFGKNKLQQTMLRITGQKKKFENLWAKANTTNVNTQEKVADELNRMFR